MPQRMYLISNPQFAEFVFNCMATATAEAKRKLNATELKYFSSPKSMRKFADNESMEKRNLLLSRLGINFCTFYAPANFPVGPMLDDIKDSYFDAAKRKDVIEAMSKGKIFALSSNDILNTMHMAAQNSQMQIYVLNREYVMLHQRLNINPNKALNKVSKEVQDGFDDFSKVVLAANSTVDICQSICGMDIKKLRILLALYPNRHTFLSAEQLMSIINITYRDIKFKHSLTDLEKEGFVLGNKQQAKRVGPAPKSYMILGPGIDAVMMYLKYIYKQALTDN